MGKNKLTPAQELEVINLYQQQMLTGEKIAGMYGVSNATIICTLKKHHIEPRRPSGRNKEKIITPEQELEIINLYQQGLTIQKIAPMYNLSPWPLARILHKHNIEVHKSKGRKAKIITPEQELEIINLYKQGFTLQKISTIYEIAIPLLRKKITKNNIVIRPSKTYIKITPEQELKIANLYKQGYAIEEIANMCNISKSSVFKSMKNNNLDVYKERRYQQEEIITLEQELEITNLYKQGYTIEKIATIYKVPKLVISNNLKKNNITIRSSKNYSVETTPEQELEIINLYQQGESVEKIADICKLPKPIVRNRLKKHNTKEKLGLY